MRLKPLFTIIAACAALPVSGTSIYAVDNPNIGKQPEAGLVEGIDKNLYGTTSSGGTNNFGTIFRVSPAGDLTTLVNFTGVTGSARGARPLAQLLLASDGNFYGTTYSGGANNRGTAFRFTPSGGFTTVVDFTGSMNASDKARGANPAAPLIEDVSSLGTFYGTTSAGGVNGMGTVFRIAAGAAAASHDFAGANGSDPEAALVQARDGSFYGTTARGGAGPSPSGTIFKFDPATGIIAPPLHTFSGSDGAAPYADLIQGRGFDLSFYGTTSAGGPQNAGTIFNATSTGSITIIHAFDPRLSNSSGNVSNPEGSAPLAGLAFGPDTRSLSFYGTTYTGGKDNLGTIYQILVSPGPKLNTLYSFSFDGTSNAPSKGSYPESKLILATDGFYYGTTSLGGPGNSGTVFRVDSNGAATTIAGFNAPASGVPVITSALDVRAHANDAEFSYLIQATNFPTSYDAQGLPPSFAVDKASGIIFRTSTFNAFVGDYTILLSASNAAGTGTAYLMLHVVPAAPVITSSPLASGTQDQPFNYQIQADGNPSSYGATGLPAGLAVNTSTGAITGTPTTTGKFAATISATNGGGTGTATLTITINAAPPGSTPTPAPAKLANLSTRGPVEFGTDVMIGGFIIQGSASKQIVMRGIGPSLTAFGVSNALQDPTLSLRDPNGNELEFNDNYTEAPQSEQDTLKANGLTPSDGRESAIATTLPPGQYTAILRGRANGIGLVEFYDISGNSNSRLVNISTRVKVEPGDNGALIGGFIIDGHDPQRVAIRAIGPSLKNFGISDALADTTLDIYRGSQLILSNDNWKTNSAQDQQTLQANGLAPSSDKEAAIVTILDPGSYSAVVRGKNNTTGVALVEVYNLN